ncbi:calphotin-like [Macrobrachium rosenbergii]|uniref:calphotin-like n=1 Tax=Macrobrachium rosenbergii TaxID=79674 RepID=UPI0034D39C2B
MKIAVLLALFGLANCRPSLIGDIEYSYVDATGRLVKVEYDVDDYLGLGWATSVPSLFRTVAALPQSVAYTPTPVSTPYVHMAPAQVAPAAAPAAPVVPRYVYVDDDDLDDDTVYLEVAEPLVARPAAARVVPRVAASPVVTRAAPAPVVAQPSPPAAPVPTLRAAVAGSSNIQVVHKYRSDDDDDDDDSEEK